MPFLLSSHSNCKLLMNADGNLVMVVPVPVKPLKSGSAIYSKTDNEAALYKVNVDNKMNKMYYINKTDQTITPVPANSPMVLPSNDFVRVGNYAPNPDTANPMSLNLDQCKSACNQGACDYIYHYTHGGTDKCVLGKMNTGASILPPNETLFLPAYNNMQNTELLVRNNGITTDHNKYDKTPIPIHIAEDNTSILQYLMGAPFVTPDAVGVEGTKEYKYNEQLSQNVLYGNNVPPNKKESFVGSLISNTDKKNEIKVTPLPAGFNFNGQGNHEIVKVTGQTGDNAYKNGEYVATASSCHIHAGPGYAFSMRGEYEFWHCTWLNYNAKINRDETNNNMLYYTQQPYTGNGEYQGGTHGSTTKYYWTTKIHTNDAFKPETFDYAGEWIQIKLPYKMHLTRYDIKNWNHVPFFHNRSAQKFCVVGSNDGVTWYLLDRQTNPDYKNIQGYATPFYLAKPAPIAYSHFRVIINKVIGGYAGDVVHFKDLIFYGIPEKKSGFTTMKSMQPIGMSTYENYENYDTTDFITTPTKNGALRDIRDKKVIPLIGIATDVSSKIGDLSSNYILLQSQIGKHTTVYTDLTRNDVLKQYDFKTANTYPQYRYPDLPPTLVDGARDDLDQMIIQENTMYILGTITTATLLGLAVMLGSR